MGSLIAENRRLLVVMQEIVIGRLEDERDLLNQRLEAARGVTVRLSEDPFHFSEDDLDVEDEGGEYFRSFHRSDERAASR